MDSALAGPRGPLRLAPAAFEQRDDRAAREATAPVLVQRRVADLHHAACVRRRVEPRVPDDGGVLATTVASSATTVVTVRSPSRGLLATRSANIPHIPP
ncbi:MAG: hypothetical protein JJE50_00330 [Actinomycetales bacterium]|nr:hypothetical protein [Actinomycetales bacterium]